MRRFPSDPTTKPLFTIVTVCWNAERSIARAIDSVAAQTGFAGSVEHLIVDGVSKDGTLAVLDRYPHLHVVSEPDNGIYDAMNKGAGLARGDYLGFLNADDWYEPGALAAVAAEFEADRDAALVHGDVRRWFRDTTLDVVKPPQGRGAFGTLVMPIHHPASVVRRDVFHAVGGFDTSYRIFADYDWVRRVLATGARLRYCPKVLTNFRLGGVSTMRFSVAERYRVLRAGGASVIDACRTVGYSCGAVLRNRWRSTES